MMIITKRKNLNYQWIILGCDLIFRVFEMFVNQSFFVADEYWQSLEVAHFFVFGKGEITWEWKIGMRSFIFPSIFIFLYQILKFLQMDSKKTLIYGPKCIMVFLLVIQDYLVFKKGNLYAFIIHSLTWASGYFGTRTLSNSLESLLMLLVICLKSSVLSLSLIIVSIWVRPTSIFNFLFLINWNNLLKFENFLFNFSHEFQQTLKKKIQILHSVFIPKQFIKSFILAIITILILILYDTIFYHSLYKKLHITFPLFICSPYNFIYYNIIEGKATFYGSQPFLFYFYSCIPSIFNVLMIFFIFYFKSFIYNEYFIFGLLFTLFLSFSHHKEIRYLHPIIPLLSISVGQILNKKKNKKELLSIHTLIIFYGILNLVALIFLGRYHEIGQTQIIRYVQSNTLFLLPCHSTPFYSYVHTNITLQFLECLNDGYSESNDFLKNPSKFMTYFDSTNSNISLNKLHHKMDNIETIIIFSSYASQISNWLHFHSFTKKLEIFNSYFEIDDINNSYISLYSKS